MAKKTGETSETFASRIDDVILSAHVMVGLSLGTRLNLFNAMCQIPQPFTSHDLACQTRCKERYVREWLHHMVVVDIVDTDDTGTKFTFPDHRRQALTSPDQGVAAMSSTFLYMLAPHEDLVKCFQADGPNGIPYEKVASMQFEFDRLSEDCDHSGTIRQFLDIPGLQEKLVNGCAVCEIGSGNGRLSIQMAQTFPRSTVVGFEINTTQISTSKSKARQSGLENIAFHEQDICCLSEKWTSFFDFIFLQRVLHDIPYVSKCLKNIHKCLKPGGRVAIIEFNVSSNIFKTKEDPMMKAVSLEMLPISMYHCLPASMDATGSDGLGACVGKEKLCEYIAESGLEIETCESRDSQLLITCKRKE